MGLSPIVLSVPARAERHADSGASARSRGPSTGARVGACVFCGFGARGWIEPPASHDRRREPACVLCRLTQDLLRPEIDREAVLIWLPEMTQGALIAIARGVHFALAKHGLRPDAERLLASAPAGALSAFSAFAALKERSAAAKERLGSAFPSELGEALVEAGDAVYGHREALLSGVRLLPLGRFYRDGRDVYPDLLAQLRQDIGGR